MKPKLNLMLECFCVLVTTQMSMNAPANHVKMAASAKINREVTNALVLVVGLQEDIATKVIEMSTKNCLQKRDLVVRDRTNVACRKLPVQ